MTTTATTTGNPLSVDGDRSTSGPVLHFPNVTLNGKSAGIVGALKIQPSGLTWKAKAGGRSVEVPAGELRGFEWWCVGPSYELRVRHGDDAVARFAGFRERDFEGVRGFLRQHLGAEVTQHDRPLRGWNWGSLDWPAGGSALEFRVDGKVAFEVPLTEVAQATVAGKHDVSVELQLDDAPADACVLAEMRLYVPGGEAGQPTAAEQLQRRLVERADVGLGAAGTGLATLKEVSLVFPRGRFDVEFYPTLVRFHGKTHDYKVLYSNITRAHQLSRSRDEKYVYLVLSLDNPVRQGQTRYGHLVLVFSRDDAPVSVSLAVEEAVYAAKYAGRVQRREEGPPADVFCRLLAGLSGKRVLAPSGAFRSHTGLQAIRCSLKANDGQLFPLERAFFFIPKPPVYVHHDEIAQVEFARVSSAAAGTTTRNFDFLITLKTGTTLQFTNMVRPEYSPLFEYVQGKKLKVKGTSLGTAGRADEGSSESEGAGPAPLGGNTITTAQLDDSEEEDADFVAGNESDDDLEYVSADERDSDADEDKAKKPKKDKKDKDKDKDKEKKDKKDQKDKKPKKHKDKDKDKKEPPKKDGTTAAVSITAGTGTNTTTTTAAPSTEETKGTNPIAVEKRAADADTAATEAAQAAAKKQRIE